MSIRSIAYEAAREIALNLRMYVSQADIQIAADHIERAIRQAIKVWEREHR